MGFMTAAIVGSSLVGAMSASSAARTQAQAATQAADAQVEAARIAAASAQRISDQQIGLSREIYDDQTQRFAPFLDAGTNALAAYNYEMGLGDAPMIGGTPMDIETIQGQGRGRRDNQYMVGDQTFNSLEEAQAFANANLVGGRQYEGISMSPGAQFALQQGVGEVEAGAAHSGGLHSGATLAGLERLRFGMAAQDRENQLNRLGGMVDMGSGAAGMQASAGNAFANQANNSLGQLGAAQFNAHMMSGQAQAQGFLGAGNAQAAGQMGVANALAGGVNNLLGWQAYQSMANQPSATPFFGGGR